MKRNKLWTRPNNGTVESGDGKMADDKVAVVVGLVDKEGSTRGKNPRKIVYKAFDVSNPDTLPKSMREFMDLTKSVNSDKEFTQPEILEYTIAGFNAAQYAAASDEIGEFIPDSWDKETASQFRLAVRNTSKLTGLDIEETVNMLKPAIEKGLAAKLALKNAGTTETVTA